MPQTGHHPTYYEKFLRRKLIEVQEFVEGHFIQAQKRQKDYDNSHCNASARFKVGDPVWLSIPHVGVSKKFDARWEGGWRVSEITGPVNVKIESSDGRNTVVHVNRLQPNIRRQDVGAEDVIRFGKSNSTNSTLITREHAITQNDSLSEGITEADITYKEMERKSQLRLVCRWIPHTLMFSQQLNCG